MNKKVLIPIVALVLAAVLSGLLITSQAFAKEGGFADRFRMARRGLGQITSIGAQQFTVQRRDGAEFTISVDENTRFLDSEKNELSFEDLETGRWVVVAPLRSDQAEITARLVVILPADFNPEQFFGARGLVASVDIAAHQFTIRNSSGEEIIFTVDDNTRFMGQAEDLADLEVDLRAIVAAEEQDDGSRLARIVRTGEFDRIGNPDRYLGKVLAVDLDSGEFSLETRQGQTVTFQVDEGTRYLDRNGEIHSLEDLQVDMIALVYARETEDGALLAVGVGAANPDQLPRFEARAIGRVVSVDHNSFTIKVRGGEEVAVQVTGSTVFRSRGGVVQSLEHLRPGMLVSIGGKELGNGVYRYQAELVLVLRLRR